MELFSPRSHFQLGLGFEPLHSLINKFHDWKQVNIYLLIYRLMSISDNTLRQYIDQIFNKYDRDRNGTLDAQELALFFNDIFRLMGTNRTISQQEAYDALRTIDQNNDGKASKMELFNAFKAILARNQYGQGGYGNQGHNQGGGWGQQNNHSGWGNQPQQQPNYSGWGNQPQQNYSGWGQQPQQQPNYSGWGNQPVQQQNNYSGWGNQPQNPQQQNYSNWGQPQQQQQPNNPYSGWGNPQQQNNYSGWGNKGGW